MRLFVNGEAMGYEGVPTLDSLLRTIGAEPARVAVTVNERVVANTEREGVVIRDGDMIEVLQFCGGG